MTDLSKLTKAQLVALLGIANQTAIAGVPQAIAAAMPQTTPEPVASLAIADSAWTALEDAVIGSYDTHTRDTTFLGAVLTFAQAVPQDWRGKPLPSTVVDKHADSVKAKLLASYGDVSKLPKDEQDRIERTCRQKHSRAKALFTCSTILAQAYEQGFNGGVVEAGKLCTELAKAKYSLAAVMEARKAAATAPRNFGEEVASLIDRILNMQAEGDTVPTFLTAKAKAQLIVWIDAYALKAKHADKYRNNPLALS